jgi:hypothetical protein
VSSYYGLPERPNLTFVTTTKTTTTGSLFEESRRESLRIVLDYAYRDIGRGIRGGTCHLARYREEGCALCDSFADVERMASATAPTENWWSEGRSVRALRWLYWKTRRGMWHITLSRRAS